MAGGDLAAPSTEEAARHLNERMVARLTEDRLLPTPRIQRAFRAVHRHHFLPGTPLAITYGGEAVPTRRDADGTPISSASEPTLLALMLEQLRPPEGARVLEVGTGTGYNAALLWRLVGPAGAVTTVELHPEVAAAACDHLAGLPVEVRAGDGWDGAPDRAPHDAIQVTLGVWDLSPRWLEQLRPGGLLAVPIWIAAGVHLSVVLVKAADGTARSRSVAPCGFLRTLQGPHEPPVGPVPVAGWLAAGDALGAAEVAALRELLAGEPRWRGARPLPPGWFLRLLRADPRAVQLADPGQRRFAAGLLLAAERSLAVVEGNEVLVYGTAAAESVLLDHLRDVVPLDATALEVAALPPGAAPEPGGWVLRRPSCTLVVRERA